VGVVGAIFVDCGVARHVHAGDIIEPLGDLVPLEQSVVQTLLPQVFKHDFVASDRVIAGLDSAVSAAAIAVRLKVALVTANALPKDVVGCKVDLAFKAVLERREVLNEVNCTI
jgi:hypothetical protein